MKYSIILITSILIVGISHPPRFEDFQTAIVKISSPNRLNIKPNSFTKKLTTSIQRCLSKGPNFSGHYSVIQFQAGFDAQTFDIVDAVTGKYFYLDHFCGEVVYQQNSSLIITDPIDSSMFEHYKGELPPYIWTRFYVWNGKRLVQIDSTQEPLPYDYSPRLNFVDYEEENLDKLIARFTNQQFKKLDWIIGSWRNSHPLYGFQYIRSDFEDDSTIRIEEFYDSLFTEKTGNIIRIRLENQRIELEAGEGNWVATKISKDSVCFITPYTYWGRIPTLIYSKVSHRKGFTETRVDSDRRGNTSKVTTRYNILK